jgi:hypothetical protein
MNALRIKRRFESPIPELPELNPLIGKDVEIIVLEEPAPAPRKVDMSALDAMAGTDALDFDAIEELRRISTI